MALLLKLLSQQGAGEVFTVAIAQQQDACHRRAAHHHIQVVQQVMTLDPEVSGELKASIADGLARKPGWKALEKVQAWLEL